MYGVSCPSARKGVLMIKKVITHFFLITVPLTFFCTGCPGQDLLYHRLFSHHSLAEPQRRCYKSIDEAVVPTCERWPPAWWTCPGWAPRSARSSRRSWPCPAARPEEKTNVKHVTADQGGQMAYFQPNIWVIFGESCHILWRFCFLFYSHLVQFRPMPFQRQR
jgi:hypothetical protein